MISLLEEKKLINLVEPGTIIEVIVPVSKSALTSWTKPKRLAFVMLITSLCLKSKPFLDMNIHSLFRIYYSIF